MATKRINMFTFNFSVKGVTAEQFKQLQDSINTLTEKVIIMSVTQEELTAQLTALKASQDATAVKQAEALAELSGIPAQLTSASASIATLTAEVAALQAQIATGQTPVISQALIDAVAGATAGQATIDAAATQLANIVPNPVV
jgi:chromosome segregation ATPase